MNWIQDVRFAVRSLRRAPTFTGVALVTLALGIGATTAIFGFLSGVVLNPLPWPDAEELMVVSKGNPRFDFEGMWLSSADFQRYQERSKEIEVLTGLQSPRANLVFEDGAERVELALIRPGFLELVGRSPSLGRGFAVDEYEPGGDPVVILSHSLWQERFGGEAEVLGTTVRVDDGERTIIGVLPPGKGLPLSTRPSLVAPLVFTEEDKTSRDGQIFLLGLARLRPGATPASAQAELQSLMVELETEQPSGMDGWVPEIQSLPERTVGDVQRPLVILFGAVLLVLLIACANVANLLLARGRDRRQEMVVRSALGASMSRLLRQLMTENLIVAIAGGTLGIGLSVALTRALVWLAPSNLPRLDEVGVGVKVMAFSFALAALSAVVFGLVPAFSAARSRLNSSRVVGAQGRWSFRDGLVVAQVALALMLLVGAGLLVRSLSGLLVIDPGFETAKILRTSITIPDYRYEEPEEQKAVLRQVLERVETIGQVESVAATAWTPLTGSWSQTGIVPEGRADLGDGDKFAFSWLVSPGYFTTMGVPLHRGRAFAVSDRLKSRALDPERTPDTRRKVAIVNQAMASRFWPDQEVLGQRFRVGSASDSCDSGTPCFAWYEIVGVSGDVRQTKLGSEASIGYYTPYAMNQHPVQGFELIARIAGPQDVVDDAIRAQVLALDSELAVGSSSELSAVMDAQLARPRFQLAILGSLALLALVLAAVGIYGVVSYSASQRVREIGVRVALGATAAEIMRTVGGRGLRLVGAGLLLGIAGAFAASRLLESLLYEVSSTDSLTFVAVASVLAGVAMAAVLIPARRATRVDPIEALRPE